MSTSNSKRPAEDPMEGTSKCHKQIASDLESDSDVEPGTIYTTTKINDVFLADKVTAPDQMKQDIADWGDPIIIIVAKTARDDLLTFLKEFRQKKSPNQNQKNDSSNTEKMEDFNCTKAKLVENDYHKTINSLNEILGQFRESDLKSNLENPEELSKFRKIRKDLTDFYIFGAKTANLTRKVNNGQTDYLVHQKHDFIPNRLPEKFMTELTEDIQRHNKALNSQMFNKTIEECHKTITFTNSLIHSESRKILAKAWRTVKRSNRNAENSDFHNRKPEFQESRPTKTRQYEPTQKRYNTDRRDERPRYTDDERPRHTDRRERPRVYDKRQYQNTYRRTDRHRLDSEPDTRRSYRTRTWYNHKQRDDSISDYDSDSELQQRRDSEYYREFPPLENRHDRRHNYHDRNLYRDHRYETHHLN